MMKKLQLNKETITSLESNQIRGGVDTKLQQSDYIGVPCLVTFLEVTCANTCQNTCVNTCQNTCGAATKACVDFEPDTNRAC
jgi:hypothetical protein